MKTLIEDVMVQVLKIGAMEIRDVDSGEEPFLYASGNWGPGYISIKNLVIHEKLIKRLALLLTMKIATVCPHLNMVAGNVTGGMIPGWLLSEYLEVFLDRPIPFCYVRGTRKKGGQKELITGIRNYEIASSSNILVVEELVNFAETTCNSAEALRQIPSVVTHAACILTYDNPEAIIRLDQVNVQLISLFNLHKFLMAAEKYSTHPVKLIANFREYLENPLRWQEGRNLKPVEGGGTQ